MLHLSDTENDTAPEPHLEQCLEQLAALNLAELKKFWRARFGAPPPLRSPELYRQILSWRLQADRYGGLDQSTRAALKRKRHSKRSGQELGIGAVLSRDWQGETIKVVVEADGFRCRGKLYKSLSALASEITGTRWNGTRFFKLDQIERGHS